MGYDWLRFFIMAALAAYLVYRVEVSTEKLLEKRKGATEVSMSAEELVLPSVTFCMESFDHNPDNIN